MKNLKIEKLIVDAKKYIETCENPCEICEWKQTETPYDCSGCGYDELSFSEKIRTYQMCAGWFTDSWLSWAFNDIGADLRPEDYGFVEYYGDEISDDDREKIASELNEFCKTTIK